MVIPKKKAIRILKRELDISKNLNGNFNDFIKECNNPNPTYTIEEVHQALSMAIKALEQEPKTGHWKLVKRGKFIDICCSNCEAVRIKEYAYNYTIDQLDKEDLKKCFESDDMRYCPNCGSDNREVEK